MDRKTLKVIAVLPAYNAERTLEITVNDIPRSCVDEIILVDDCSKDKTVEVGKRIGLKNIFVHKKNTGYGGNQKTCYEEALKLGADIVVMIHPDYQYDPKLVSHLVAFISEDICDVMLGNRIRTRKETIAGGMPLYKYFANRILTIIENLFFGENLGEWHTGLRAYSKKVLQTVNWELNSDDFVFDQQFLMQCAACGFRIGDIPVPSKYFGEASSINFARSMKYGVSSMYYLLRYFLHKTKLVKCKLFYPKS